MKQILIACLVLAAAVCAADTVTVTPPAPTSRDSLHFSLFNQDLCCCAAYYYNSAYVQDTMIILSYDVDQSACAACYCLVPGSTTAFSMGPVPAGKYAVYKLQNIYCPPGQVCPYGIAAPQRVGEITVLPAQAAGDSLVVRPESPTVRDSLFFDLYRASHCCCTQYYYDTVVVEDTAIYLSYAADNSLCMLCDCVAMGKWHAFETGPLRAGTYAIYRVEDFYCKPGDPCPAIAVMPARIGEVTVTRRQSVENTVSFLGASVQASPNPFRSSVRITVNGPGNRHADLRIYDLQGKLIEDLSQSVYRYPSSVSVIWDGSGLPGGVYVLKVKTGGSQSSKKLYLYK